MIICNSNSPCWFGILWSKLSTVWCIYSVLQKSYFYPVPFPIYSWYCYTIYHFLYKKDNSAAAFLTVYSCTENVAKEGIWCNCYSFLSESFTKFFLEILCFIFFIMVYFDFFLYLILLTFLCIYANIGFRHQSHGWTCPTSREVQTEWRHCLLGMARSTCGFWGRPSEKATSPQQGFPSLPPAVTPPKSPHMTRKFSSIHSHLFSQILYLIELLHLTHTCVVLPGQPHWDPQCFKRRMGIQVYLDRLVLL